MTAQHEWPAPDSDGASAVRDPFHDLRIALFGGDESEAVDSFAHLDPRREQRKGVPEVILAGPKQPEQVVAVAQRFLERVGRAIISRTPPATLGALEQAFGDSVAWERYDAAQVVVLRRHGLLRPQTGGQVGIITAGTADVPRAEEAAVVCREMGCEVHLVCDVGVAGLHRLIEPLRRMMGTPVDVIVVAAGMDGALPSVVAGLVDVPVIGLPTSVGYGIGGQGQAALLSMLQTCSPGLAVVNIDNGVGAGAMAAVIANNVARARTKTPREHPEQRTAGR
ncbi:MAG TPA: nickel pincer cofactor biosynthesis protein LarB [Herpetosiphonaceae bacterium]